MPKHTFSDKYFGDIELNVVSVKMILTKLLVLNRQDLIDELKVAWAKSNEGKPFPEYPKLASEEIASFLDRTLNDGYYQSQVAWGPKEFPGAVIPIHKGSKDAWLRAKCGNCFTGVVRVGVELLSDAMPLAFAKKFEKSGFTTKIFMLPCAPSEKYPTRPWDDFEARLYEALIREPIIHGNVGAGGKQSHRQLVDVINEKEDWEELTQKRAFFLGFTVVKGSDSMPDRFAFTSMSSNKPTHLPHMKTPIGGGSWMIDLSQRAADPVGTVTIGWARKIASSIAALPKSLPVVAK